MSATWSKGTEKTVLRRRAAGAKGERQKKQQHQQQEEKKKRRTSKWQVYRENAKGSPHDLLRATVRVSLAVEYVLASELLLEQMEMQNTLNVQ